MALVHISFFSNTLGTNMEADVILPQNTSGQIGMEGRATDICPTLYLLHGMSDDHTTWQRRTSIERYVSTMNIAVVMPTTGLGWYTDMECGYQKYYTYVSEELPKICRSFFKCMSDDRDLNWIGGLSMGGYGALKIALNKSENFSKAVCFSSAFDIEQYPDEPYWISIFGQGEQRKKHTIGYAVDKLIAENRPKPEVFMRAGLEDALLQHSRDVHEILEKNGFSVTYSEAHGGHNWGFWDEAIQLALPWLKNE